MPKSDWSSLTLPSFERVEWCPALPPGFEGVKIWAPPELSLRTSKGRLPIFGTVSLGRETMKALKLSDDHPLRAVVVGAIIERINQGYVGNAVLQAPLFAPQPGPIVTEYFAVDLVECTGVLRSTGGLFAFASVGAYTAEPVTIRIVA